MYMWNGYTVIGKHKDLTEGMLKTLDEAQAKLESSPSKIYLPIWNMSATDFDLVLKCLVVCLSGSEFTTDDQCLLSLLKGLCLKHLGHHEEAEHYFTLVLCK